MTTPVLKRWSFLGTTIEQLRALEAGMSIAVTRVDAAPLSVDTPADLEKARKILS